MTTEVNVILDSSAKKVKFEDVAVGSVFEYEGAYYMRIKPQFGVNSLKVYSPKSETDEATDSDVFTTVLFPFSSEVIPHDSTLNIEV
jgi:hypothetical protein